MDEERFNLSLRKLLKQFGVTSQREIEKAVYAARDSGGLGGRRSLRARVDNTERAQPEKVPNVPGVFRVRAD